jgi:hypothetical protein
MPLTGSRGVTPLDRREPSFQLASICGTSRNGTFVAPGPSPRSRCGSRAGAGRAHPGTRPPARRAPSPRARCRGRPPRSSAPRAGTHAHAAQNGGAGAGTARSPIASGVVGSSCSRTGRSPSGSRGRARPARLRRPAACRRRSPRVRRATVQRSPSAAPAPSGRARTVRRVHSPSCSRTSACAHPLDGSNRRRARAPVALGRRRQQRAPVTTGRMRGRRESPRRQRGVLAGPPCDEGLRQLVTIRCP